MSPQVQVVLIAGGGTGAVGTLGIGAIWYGASPLHLHYLRVPAALSGLLFLVWFPLILRLRTRYQASSPRHPARRRRRATATL